MIRLAGPGITSYTHDFSYTNTGGYDSGVLTHNLDSLNIVWLCYRQSDWQITSDMFHSGHPPGNSDRGIKFSTLNANQFNFIMYPGTYSTAAYHMKVYKVAV